MFMELKNPEFMRKAKSDRGRTWLFRASVISPQGRMVICNRVEVSLGTTNLDEAIARRDVLVSFLGRARLLSDAGERKLEGLVDAHQS